MANRNYAKAWAWRKGHHRLARPQAKNCGPALCPYFVRRLIENASRQQQAQRTLLEWPRVEYAIEKPSNKLLAVAELDSDNRVGEEKRIRGKKRPLTATGVHALPDEYNTLNFKPPVGWRSVWRRPLPPRIHQTQRIAQHAPAGCKLAGRFLRPRNQDKARDAWAILQ